ncbi:RNA polymerase sigma factor [Marinovum sp.]|uniref:RNA polymerase sigma factor n=1 Tax=Marinovum sp. TaxID=2024839 RepID=UPI002B277F3C|nr:RNA polymerase sigma factor [Marinovum sp.]
MTRHALIPAPLTALPPASEAELVEGARAGNEVAIRELVRRLNPRLFRVARGIMPSDTDAEEVVQEAYLNAFSRLAQFDGRARFSTWITRIAINAARMRLRRARFEEDYDTVNETETDAVIAFPGQHQERPETALGRSQVRDLLETAIAALPSDLRLPFLLREVEGMTLRDIAEDLSLNAITVRTRLFRARRRLRAILEARIEGGFDQAFPFAGTRCAGMADRVIAELCAPTTS